MAGPLAEFSSDEYLARWSSARSRMAAQQLDALLITSESNYRYLSGHITPFWVSKSRPFAFLLPLEGPPLLIVAASQLATVRATSWVEDVRTYAGFADAALAVIVEAIVERGLDDGRIGMELGEEQRLGLPYNDVVQLFARFPSAAFVDAASLFWEMRLIKSSAEITYLRQSAAIASDAYQDLFAAVRPGMTEREVFALYVASTIRRGADQPGYVPVHSGDGHYDRISAWPSSRALQAGDLLWLDGGCVVHGYWSDFARMVAIGSATTAQRARYRLVHAAMNEAIALIKPGATMAELTARAAQVLASAGVQLHASGRVGHGLGLDVTEPPSINADDPTIVQPGMVLTMEPTSGTDYGFFQLEENVVVTETGCELLTEPAPAELPIVD